jgi:hypothetical protein
MTTSDGYNNPDLIAALHRAHEDVTSRQLSLLEIVAGCDAEELWRNDGARDTASWLAAHLGISHWAARAGPMPWWRSPRPPAPKTTIPIGRPWWSTPSSAPWCHRAPTRSSSGAR